MSTSPLTFDRSCYRRALYPTALCLLLLSAWPRPARAATTPHVAIIQCDESYQEDSHTSQMSSQALVGLAVLLGVEYHTLLLEELLDEPPDRFTSLWFSSCLWVGESNHARLVTYLADALNAGGSVFLDGPLGAYYRDSSGVEQFRGTGEVAAILGIDWGGWHATAGYDIATTDSLHPVAERAGYGLEETLTVGTREGTDTLVPADPTAETLLQVVSPFAATSYPFLVVAEPVGGTRVAAIGGYGNFVGVASPFHNSPSPAFSDNQVLPYLLQTLIWTIAPDDAPFAGLEISAAPVTMLGRLDGDWSDVPDATEATLTYLDDLAMETGIATVYGIVSDFAEAGGSWSVFADFAPTLQELGGSIGSHSRTHPDDMSATLETTGWQSEVAGSLADIRQALTSGGFAPDAYAFINPGNTIHAGDYGEFFDDVELYMSHGYEPFTPYSSGVVGFGPGVPATAVINDVVAPDYQWLYSPSWVYTVDEAATLQARILDYYQKTVGRGVIYNQMWHDYSLGGNATPEHYPDTTSTLPLYETARQHFWQSEVYAPTVAEAMGKLYVSQATVITSSYGGDLVVDLDYSAVPAKYRQYVAGMGLRIHQRGAPIQRVVIDGVEHFGFSDKTIIMPAPSGSTQHVTIELGSSPPDYRLRYASKPVTSVSSSGGGVVATLAQPGMAMKYCFAGPEQSVVLGADAFARTSGGESCGHMVYGHAQSQLAIQPLDTGALNLSIRRATRPLSAATATQDGVHIDYQGGGDAVIELASPTLPSQVIVDGALASPTPTAEGFSVALPGRVGPGAMEVSFGAAPAPTCDLMETSCTDGVDNDCDGLIDCADDDCAGGGSCVSPPRQVVLAQISDATLRQPEPQSNFGSEETLEIDTADEFKVALIKPDNLADVAPGSQVVSARLVFQIFDPGDTVEVREVLGAWSEAQVSWNGAPPMAQSAYTTFAGDVGQVSIDVTGIVQGWVDSGTIGGLALYPTGDDGVDAFSSEYADAAMRPYFVLEVSGGGQCPDGDADGHVAGFCGGDDCDDGDASSYPGAPEICDDGSDNDCDGASDCADADCDGVGSCGTAPRQVVVTGLSDATLRDSDPNTGFGGNDTIEIDTADVFQIGLIKPDSLGDIAPGAQVVSARLVFRIFDPGDSVEVRQVLGAWSEAAVTWSSAPPLAQSAYTTVSGDVGQVSIDITDIAQAWVDGAPIDGLALYPTGSDGVDAYSSEYGDPAVRPSFVFEVIDGGGGGGGGGGQPCPDGDADGHLAAYCGGDDCDDADAATHPGAAEQCGDGLDNDCDSQLDCADGDCAGDAQCSGGSVVTIVLENLDDAYVSDGSPSTNLGASESLQVDTWSEHKRTFIKPNDLGGIPPGSQIVSAHLLIDIYDAGDQVTLAEASASWSEGSITWNNAPSPGAAFGSLPAQTSGSVALDVTDLVQRWVNGAPVYGLALEPTSSNSIKLRSSEYSDPQSRPQIVIEVMQ